MFPLLLAYHMPAVFALVGAWMDAPDNATVRYGDSDVPRSNFLSWEQAREMQASGLAEFASHSYGLHTGVPGNAFGSRFPSAAAWQYDTKTKTWETDASLRARVRADLEKSRALMRARLGRAPRALVWPFGRYAGPALQAATAAGFGFALGLDSEPADAARPMEIPRYYPAHDPRLGGMAETLRFADPRPATRRVACLDAAPLGNDAALGEAIENLRRLGANMAVLGAAADRETESFVSWQIRTRAGVDLFVRIDPRADPATIGDAVRAAPVDGVFIEHPGTLAAAAKQRVGAAAWLVRAARDAVDPATLDADGRRAFAAWRQAVALRPGLRLGLPADDTDGDWPAPAADFLIPAPPADFSAFAATLQHRGWLAPDIGPRLALPLPPGRSAIADMRAAQIRGATAFALCPAPLPADAALRAAFSASTYPLLR